MKNPLESKRNIALFGAAGTGKTTLINEYRAAHPERNILMSAPTGTAAVNIGGVTCHRLFGIPVPAYGGDVSKVPSSVIKIIAMADDVIIDEISTARNDGFAFSMKVLARCKKETGRRPRLIVVGDFSQLPPVVKKTEDKFFTKYGFHKSGYAFTTKEWADQKFEVVVLTEVKRQDNVEFIKHLNEARIGSKKCLKYFNSFYGKPLNDGIYVCGTNAEADRVNNEYLDALDAPMSAYRAKTDGIVGKEMPCDEIVLLKEGCKVMFTANDTAAECVAATGEFDGIGRYINGMFGTVLKVYSDSVDVETEKGQTINVTYHSWPIYKYKIDRTSMALTKEEIGSISQIPLKVAKAITIHKSQGKTFDEVIISPQIFAPGQLYVALSRVRNPEGLVLTEPILEEYLKIDPIVKKFYDADYTYEVSEAIIKKQKEIDKKVATKNKKTTKKRKSTTKKTSTRRSTTKKTATKKVKPAAKRTTAKKSTAKKVTAKKTTAKKPTRKPVKASGSRKTTKKATTRRVTKKTTRKPVKRARKNNGR